MSRRNRYPNLGSSSYNPKRKRGYCAACGADAYGSVEVQHTWFRADDVKYLTCKTHHRMAREDTKQFVWLVRQRE